MTKLAANRPNDNGGPNDPAKDENHSRPHVAAPAKSAASKLANETQNRDADQSLLDPFDPARLALKGNPAEALGVKRALVHVPVRKPNKQEFFRAHPDPALRIRMAGLDFKTEREFYAVLPEVAVAIPGETRPAELTTCVNRQGNIFLWPVPLPSEDGRELAWHSTAREGASRAEDVWVRMVPNMGAGAYDIFEAPATIAEPAWGEYSLQDLLRVAFSNGRLVESVDHPVIRQLLGQA